MQDEEIDEEEGEGNDDEEGGDETDAGTTSQEESSPAKGKPTVGEAARTNKPKKRQLESSSSSSSLSNASMSSVKGGSGDEIDTEMSTSKSEPSLAMAALDKKLAAQRKQKEENKENQQTAPLKTEMPAAQLNICYKFINTETRLLRKILNAHGMGESGPECNDFNLLWTGIHLKPDILRNLAPYQRVNHFPRWV